MNDKSAQTCGCDEGANHKCERHSVGGDKGFIIKDSGERQVFAGGMQRDTTIGKTDYSLVLDGPMLERWAVHMTKGAVKYEPRNWMRAAGLEEYARFKSSAFRHFLQWYRDVVDEDHASAVYFNINGAEFLKEKL